jgi:hypothetical protein
MRKLAALAAFALVGIAAPAHAGPWYNVGTVDFDRGGDHERQYNNFGGPIERLSFTASGNDVKCRVVTATFSNGRSRDVFQGGIRQGSTVTVDLPGRQREVRRLDFRCRSDGHRVARIAIGADIGQYSDVWRRNPSWAYLFRPGNPGPLPPGTGSPVPPPGHGYPPPGQLDGWVRLGVNSFEGRSDHEAAAYTGWRGNNVDRIGVRAMDGDAQCRRIYATFGNGKTRELDVGNRGYLRQGELRVLDLPGGQRDVVRLTMICRPAGDRRVTIESYGRK